MDKDKSKSKLVINEDKGKIQYLTCNLKPAEVRMDTLEGREHMVVPMVMLVEGVHEGSGGPLLYTANEMKETPIAWNHKPIVVYHPQANGEFVSAADPVVLSKRKIGVILNTRFEQTENGPGLKAEAWLEPNRIKAVDDRVGEAIQNGEMVELSTGLWVDVEPVEGDWKGEHYDAIAVNHRPDHLAILPDVKGACSIADGAGLLRVNAENKSLRLGNSWADEYFPKLAAAGIDTDKLHALEMSHGNLRSLLQSALSERDDSLWIEEVYNDFIIYEDNGKLWMLKFTEEDGQIQLDDMPVEVIRVIEYRTASGSFVGNKFENFVRKEMSMDKKKSVDALISNENTSWTEDHRDFLMEQDEEKLNLFAPVVNDEQDNVDNSQQTDTESDDDAEQDAQATEQVTNQQKTVEDFINNDVPAEYRDMLKSGLDAHNNAKANLIAKVMTNQNNTFSKDHLEMKDLAELTALAKLAVVPEQAHTVQHNPPLYIGQAAIANEHDSGTLEEEPLPLPVMNWNEDSNVS
jgi:hypothetical protein